VIFFHSNFCKQISGLAPTDTCGSTAKSLLLMVKHLMQGLKTSDLLHVCS